MKIAERFAPLMGRWQGVNQLRIMPTDDYRESPATVTVGVAAQGFVTFGYTWAEDGKPQDGLLMLGDDAETEEAKAVWVDSWHSSSAWMNLAGRFGDDGVLRLIGSYPAPDGPDWGGQIHLTPGNGEGGTMTMHNVVPGHEPYQCVEATYDRAS